MVGESAVERPENRLFGLPVGLGSEIARVGLAFDLDPAQAPQIDKAGLREALRSWLLHHNRGQPHSSLGPELPDPPLNLLARPNARGTVSTDQAESWHTPYWTDFTTSTAS